MAADPTFIVNHVANLLKELRRARGWSLDVASQKTGLSKPMLGQIERGVSVPTVTSLWKIATGFGVAPSVFFEDASLNNASPRDQQRFSPQQEGSDGMNYELMVPYDDVLRFEVFRISIQPGCEHISSGHKPGTMEHIIPIQGSMEVFSEGEWHHLAEQQVFFLYADQQHGYRNVSDMPCMFHDMVHYA